MKAKIVNRKILFLAEIAEYAERKCNNDGRFIFLVNL